MENAGTLFIVLTVLSQLTPPVQTQSIAYQDNYITVKYARIKNGYWAKITVMNNEALILGWAGELPSLRRLPHIRECHTLLARRSEFDIYSFKAYKYKGRILIILDFTLMNYTVKVVLPRK